MAIIQVFEEGKLKVVFQARITAEQIREAIKRECYDWEECRE
jgi:citrate lyase gamma subunit